MLRKKKLGNIQQVLSEIAQGQWVRKVPPGYGVKLTVDVIFFLIFQKNNLN